MRNVDDLPRQSTWIDPVERRVLDGRRLQRPRESEAVLLMLAPGGFDAVLLTGFTDLDEASTLLLLYVGASRARALLGLVLDEHCKQAYKERARDVVERLLGVGA